MVAIVSGNGFGLTNTSGGVLGQQGLFGGALHGSGKEGAYVNVFNGNLSLQDGDGFLASSGLNLALTRTYNSQAALSDTNNNGWQDALLKQVKLVGTLNAGDSYLQRIDADGSVATFKYQSPNVYVSTNGGGGFQTITYAPAVGTTAAQWTWRADRTDLNGPYEVYDTAQAGYIVKAGDQSAVRLNYTYTKLSATAFQLNKVTDAAGDSMAFAYDAKGNLGKVTITPSGGTAYALTYTYDAQNRLSTVTTDLTPAVTTDALFYTTTYTYGPDVNGLPSQLIVGVAQSDGTRLDFDYDANGRVISYATHTSANDGVGHVTTFSYGVDGLTTSVTDPLRNVTTYGYDGAGQLTSISVPGVGTTTYTYDAANGNVLSMTDARGLRTDYTYDDNGRRTGQRDTAGNTVTRVYASGSGLLLSETTYLAPSDNWAPTAPQTTRYAYDKFNRLRYVVTAEGRVTEYSYPSLTAATQVEHDAVRQYTVDFYTPAGTAPLDMAVLDKWNGTKTLTQTTYAYVRGRVSQAVTVNSDGATAPSTTSYTYLPNGQLLSSVDGNGYVTSYTYDGLGRQLTKVVANKAGTKVSSASTAYAGMGAVVTDTLYNPLTNVAYASNISTYDAAGELLNVQQSGVVGRSTNGYDAEGHLRITTNPGGQSTFWLYDKAGRQVAEIDATGALTELVYNQSGQVIRTIRYAAALTDQKIIALATRNADGSVADAALDSFRPAATPQDRSSWNFYDNSGRLADAVDAAGYVTHYDYDGAARLTATLRAIKVDTAALAAKTTTELQQMTAVAQSASAEDRVSRKLYDNDGLLVGQIDALGYLTEYRYNAAGLLVETIAYYNKAAATGPATGTVATLRPVAVAGDLREYRVYDAQRRLVGTVDSDGYLTELSYDIGGNIAKRTSYANKAASPAAATLALIRSSIPNSTSGDNRSIAYTYNSDGQVLTATNVFMVKSVNTTWTTTNTYDLNGKLTSTTHSNGGTTDSATYDGQGRLLTESNGTEKPTVYTYNANGLRASMTAPDGKSTYYYYDADGRPTYTVDATGQVRQQSYNNFDQVVSVRDYATRVDTSGLRGGQDVAELTSRLGGGADDRRTLFYYDTAGRLGYTVAADGAITGQTYNAFGQVATTVRYGALVAAATVLGAGPVQMSSDMLAIVNSATLTKRTSSFAYDADGRLTYSIDPQGAVQAKDYDAFGRVASVKQYATPSTTGLPGWNAGDSVQSYAYNERGQVIDYTDAVGNHLVTSYNGFGEVVAQAKRATPGSAAAGALDSVTRTVYDENGAVAATIDPLGAVTTYQYDGDGKVVEKFAYSAPLAAAQLSTLDAQLANGGANGGVSVADTLAGYLRPVAALDARQQFVYNDSGRLVATYTAKASEKWSVSTLTYDENGNVTERLSYAGLLTHISPMAVANVLTPVASASDARTRLVYDANGRVTETLTAQTTGAWSLVSQTYDAFGNVLQRTAYAKLLSVAAPGAADIKALKDEVNPANAVTIYRYDKANRVVLSATAQTVFYKQVRWAVTAYTYDAAGQLRGTTAYANAQLVDAGGVPSGPPSAFPTLDRTTSYTYDATNRLLSTTDALGGVTLLEYDTRGNVTKRTQKSAIAGEADRVSRVIYDLNNRPVYQIDAAGGVTQRTYDALGNVSAVTTYATPIDAAKLATTGIDRLLTKLPAQDRTERYIYDADGQLRYTVDAGGYLQQRAYDALGRVLATTTYANPVKPTDFAGAADYNVAKAATVAATLGLARATKMVYDAQGKVSTVTDPENFVERYTYDGLGNKLTYVNQLGATWSYTYDAVGRLLTSKDPAVTLYANGATATSAGASVAMTTVLAYDALGNLTSRTEAQGSATARSTGYEYDLRGRQVRTILPALAVYDAAAAADASGRSEGAATVHAIQTIYGTLGDAVVSVDIGGSNSYKVYDVLGRVAYDVDATGYVTGYQRNGFGEVTALTRYATPLTYGQQGQLLDYHRLPDGMPTSALDRTVRTGYDQLGRAVSVTEPMVSVYDQEARASYSSARTTITSYDAFGQVYLQSTYGAKADGGKTAAAVTRSYYDARGNKSAQISVLSDTPGARSGYLTTYVYDADGNQTGVLEYARAIGGWSDIEFNPGVADSADRQSTMLYDGNQRKILETKVGAQLSATGAASDIKISYKYDATGNQTVAAIEGGVTTMTYYDALGRSIAIAQLAPAGDTTKMPLSAFRLDAYGNVVVRIDYAGGAPRTGVDVNGNSAAITGAVGTAAAILAVPAATAGDRVTLTSYDIAGHATQISDANKNLSYSSYDVYGRVAKQWRVVSNAAMGLGPQTIYQTNQYDVLGHLVVVETPGNGDLVNAPGGAVGVIRQSYTFNAFGEAETHTTSDGTTSWTEYTDYDNAGRAWRTNVGDGADKVTLYDAQGNATVLVRSGATDQNQLHALKTDVARAEDALSRADVLRTDTRYDLLGRAVDTRQGGEPTLTILVPKDGTWQAVPVAPGNAANGLLVVGDSRDQEGSVTVQYRANADSPWIDQSGARVWSVGGNIVFNTAGLTGGAYQFRVIVRPAGEAAFERQRGNITVSSGASDAQNRLVAQLYVVLMNRAPDLGGLNFHVQGLNNGGSLAAVVHGFLASDEAKQTLPADATALVRYIHNVFGGGSEAEIGVWAGRYAAGLAAGANKEGQVVADLIEALLYQRSPSPARLAAQQRVTAKVTATLSYALTYSGNDPTSGKAVFDQAGTDLAAALNLAQTYGTDEMRRSQVAQAYLILFARATEPGGMRFWLDALSKAPVEAVIEGMLNSPEATDPTLYPVNADRTAYDLRFVNKIYNNVLGRAPTADELAEAAKWMGEASSQAVRHGHFVLEFAEKVAAYSGTDSARLTQKQLFHNKLAIALRFAQMDFTSGPLAMSADQQGMVAQRIIAAVTADTSTETAVAQALATVATNAAMATTVADALGTALQRTPLETMQLKIAQLYVALLARTPDSGGFAFQVDALKRLGGTDAGLAAIAAQFLSSEETLSDPRLGAVTSMGALQFVQHIYQLALGQVPTSAGAVKEMNAFAAQLSTISRAEVALNIINGMLRFSGLTADESALKARFNNKVAVGLATAIDLAPFNWGDKTQPGIGSLTLSKVTATDTQAALTYAYGQAQANLRAMAAGLTNTAAAAQATQAATATAALAASDAADALKLATAQAAAQATAALRLQVMRIYVGILGRDAAVFGGTPDLDGFNFQVDAAGKVGMGVLVQGFIDSEEGGNRYRNLTNDQFVDKVVATVLGSSDAVPPADLARWRAQLAAPASLARGQVAFNILNDIQNYGSYTPDAAAVTYLAARQKFYQRVGAAMTVIDGEQQKAANAAAAAVVPVTQADAVLPALLDAQTKTAAAQATAAQAATNALNAANGAGDGNAAMRLQVTKLYATLLQRPSAPTLDELYYYVSGAGKNPPAAIAYTFINSDEAKARGGFPADNAGFISKLYQLILGRSAGPDEIAYWSVQLNNKTGAPYERGLLAVNILDSYSAYSDSSSGQLTQKIAFDQKINSFMAQEKQEADAVAAAALSTYNSLNATATSAYNAMVAANNTRDSAKAAADQAATLAVDADTVLAQPAWQRTITTIYLALRGDVDFGGLAFHTRNLAAGAATTASLIDALLAANSYPADKEGFVKALYSNIMKRTPSADEVAFWVNGMTNSGLTRASVVNSFLTSDEGVQRWTGPTNTQVAADIRTAQARVAARGSTAGTYNTALAAANTASGKYTTAANNLAPAAAANTTAARLAASAAAINTARASVIPADQAYVTAAQAREAYASAKAKSDQLHVTYATQLAANAAAQPAAAANHAAAAVASAAASSAAASVNVAKAYIGEVSAPILQRQIEQVAQLYVSLFNRAPQLSELLVWSNALSGGMTPTAVAAALIKDGDPGNSQVMPAALGNDAFVTQLYKFGLSRDFSADPNGLRFWSDLLGGPNPISRAELVISWLNGINLSGGGDTYRLASNAQAALRGVVAEGAAGGSPDLNKAIALAEANARAAAAATTPAGPPTPAATLVIAPLMRLYIGLLNRTPDMGGFASWVKSSVLGVSMEQIAQGILTSPEGQQVFAAGLGDRDFLAQVYRNATGRAPLDAELAAVLAQMGGITRGEAALRLLNGIADGPTATLQQSATRAAFNAKVYAAIRTTQFEQGSENGYIRLVTGALDVIGKTKLLDQLTDGIVYGVDTRVNAGGKYASGPDQLTLDRWGNVLVRRDVRDPNWTVSYSYNDAGQVVNTASTGGGLNITSSTVYDRQGNVVQTVDGELKVNKFDYDANGALLREFHADNATATASITYVNDAFGQHLSTQQNVSSSAAGAVVTGYEYDNMGHLLSRKTASVTVYWWNPATATDVGAAGVITDRYTYDELGRRTSATNTNSSTLADPNKTSVTYTRYDLGGNIVGTTGTGGQVTLSSYDMFNHKTGERVATGELRSWRLDAYGRVVTGVDLGGNITRYQYNANGQLIRQFGADDAQASVAGAGKQNLTYTYEQGSGRLLSIDDAAENQLTTYTYDAAGNRVTEKTWMTADQYAAQDNTLSYDAAGRLTDVVSAVTGANYKVHYDYDRNGNRTREKTEFTNDAGVANLIDVTYKYDEMNRVKNVSGINKAGAIVPHTITYNWMGNRLSDNGETYLYDLAGRLSQIKNSAGAVIGERHYDGAGRAVSVSDTADNEIRLNQYDRAGRLLKQRVTAATGAKALKNTVDYAYDDLNNLTSTKVTTADNKTQTTTYTYDKKTDSYKLTKTEVRNGTDAQAKRSIQHYDANGYVGVVGQYNLDGSIGGSSSYIFTLGGRVLQKAVGIDLTHSLIVNDELIGSSSNSYESFSIVHDPITSPSVTTAPSVYVVQTSSETLQSVAKAVWGDERLWYLIDEANGGLSAPLAVGQQLLIPPRVSAILNSYQTITPYSQAEAIGNTTPTLAMPAAQGGRGGCGIVGKLIMVVVAVAVTYITAGAAANAIYAAYGGLAGTTAAAAGTLGGALATAAGGAIGAAAGSIASQAAGIAIGAQDGFSWSAVAQAGLAGGVTAGIGQMADFGKLGSSLQSSNWAATAARAAISNAVTQGISNMTGLQRGFSWSGVAGAFVGSSVASSVSSGLARMDLFSDGVANAAALSNSAKFAINTISGIASGITTSVVRGGKINLTQIATDAFGNALGSSLAESINSGGGTVSPRPIRNFSSITTVDSSGPLNDISDLLAGVPDMGNLQSSNDDAPDSTSVFDYLETDPYEGIDLDLTSSDVQLIAGIGSGGAKSQLPKGISRATYVFGTESDDHVRELLSQVNMKNIQANSKELLSDLQTSLGFEGNNVTSYLDKATYRAIRDWKVDFNDRMTVDMADSLLNTAIRPALKLVGNSSPAMENLLLGTAIQESYFFTYRSQQGGGPGTGLFQVEPDSGVHVLTNLNNKTPELFEEFAKLGSKENLTKYVGKTDEDSKAAFKSAVKSSLQDSDVFGAAIAAKLYSDRMTRNSISVPQSNDVQRMGEIWKRLYNTSSGKGEVSEYVNKWNTVFKGKR